MSDLSSSPCPCSDPQDPQVVSNPPGLDAISYRVDDFTGFRRALLRTLPGEQAIGNWQSGDDGAALVNWRPAPGDLGLMVLEWWAYLADILTFYNERIANESYLRTAQLPASLADLVALIGYEPAPALAATGTVAAMRSAGKPGLNLLVPPAMRLASAAANGIPSQVFEVTTTTTTTFSGPSDVALTLIPDDTLQVTASSPAAPASVLLAGTVSGVKQNDRLVLVPKAYDGTHNDDSWSYVTVASVGPLLDPSTGKTNTLVTFVTTTAGDAGWGPQPAPLATPTPSPSFTAPPPTATPTSTFSFSMPSIPSIGFEEMLIRRPAAAAETGIAVRERVAGPGFHEVEPSFIEHELPGAVMEHVADTVGPPAGAVSTDYRLLKPTATAALWSANVTSSQPAVTGGGTGVHLSAAVHGISPGDMVLFDTGAGAAAALAIVATNSDAVYAVAYPTIANPPKPADLVVTHTVLTLTLPWYDQLVLAGVSNKSSSVTVRYAFKDVGTVIAVPQQELSQLGGQAWVPTTYVAPAGGAKAFLVDPTGQGVFVEVTAAGQYPSTGTATSNVVNLLPTGTPPSSIGTPLVPPLRLLLDLLPVSRGQTVTNEVLGSGNAALVNQSFTLAKGPLTYLASGNGWTSTLSVWVGGVAGILWQEVESFFGQPPDAQVYVVSRSADQSVTTVTFGDGVNGARLPTGSGNVVATYRYGSGAASPPVGTLTTIMQPQPQLSSIRNPVAVAPGKDRELPADVRANAPASIFTFGRAISAIDYEVVASQAPGVARVAAVWSFDGTQQRTLVTVYVGDDGNAVAAASAALAGAEDPNRPVSVQQATAIQLGLSCTLVVAADRQIDPVVAAATTALVDAKVGLFSPSQMGIGSYLYRSAVDAALSVDGVVAVHDLSVTWPVTRSFGPFQYLRYSYSYRYAGGHIGFGVPHQVLDEFETLDEVFNPGEGNYFTLGTPTIVGVSA